MKVWHMQPYSCSRNLGVAYNEYLSLIPDGDAACLTDGDSMFLTPDWGHIIQTYAEQNPNAVLTCWVSRLHELAKGQLYQPQLNTIDDCLKEAEKLKARIKYTTLITGSVSGTLLVIPKHIWQQHKFSETNTFRPGEPNLLGVDNYWTNLVRRNGVQVLRMDGVLIYHQYRLLSAGQDKSHLK